MNEKVNFLDSFQSTSLVSKGNMTPKVPFDVTKKIVSLDVEVNCTFLIPVTTSPKK